MPKSSDYTVIKRGPPFKGLSLAQNEVGTEKGFATEVENIEFQRVTGPENETISQRPGWRKLGAFAVSYSDFTEYRDALISSSSLRDNAPAIAAGISGAMLFGPNGAESWVPTRLLFSNPNKHFVQIKPSASPGETELYINGLYISNYSGAVSNLADGLAGFGITVFAISPLSTRMSLTTTHYPTQVLDNANTVIMSLEDSFSSSEYFYVNGRQLLKQVSVSIETSGFPSTSLPALLYKSVLTPSNVAHAYASQFLTQPLISDGTFQELVGLISAASATPTAGANFYEYAVQAKYQAIHDGLVTNEISLQGADAQVYTGALSNRAVASSATLPITVAISTTGMANRGLLIGRKNGTDYPSAGFQQIDTFFPLNVSANPGAPATGAQRSRSAAFFSGLTSSTAVTYAGSGSANSGYYAGTSYPVTNEFGMGLNVKFILWRTKAQTTAAAASTAVLYKVAEFTPDASGNYVDSIVDASLVQPYLPAASEPSNLNLYPFKTTAATFHQGRAVFGSSTGIVAFSNPDELQNFNLAVNSQLFNTGITALASLNDILYVFCKEGIYAITGALGTLDSSVQFLGAVTLQKGVTSAQGSVCVGGSTVFFISSEGLAYVINGLDIKPIPQYQIFRESEQKFVSEGTNYFPPSTSTDLRYIGTQVSRIRTGFSASSQEFSVGLVGETSIDIIDSQGRWSTYTLPAATVLQDLGSLDGTLTVLTSSAQGSELYQIYRNFKIDQNTTASVFPTSSIAWKYATSWEDLGDTRTEKQFTKVQIDMPNQTVSQNATLDVTVEYDWIAGAPGQKVSFPLRVSQGWGESPWGSVPWGDINQVNCVIPLSQEKHRSMRIIFEGTQNLAISGWSIEVAQAGAHAKQGTPSNAWVG